ncbi:SGNH/GDSL hydrolase family protein [Antiquaquibacter soli]|uniref:SGNH/GDSL hydrolase family protein n=1 Tax=Antiquaquibacter soli TaxID=3064523 RepID=A0ABT9BSU5_9MICO|nr:SGNH/GDSL hydrolase family protein [Protaetiibacter sp. WY-16]MDO7883477.1 SGNH/GDSL hydrolase family protein [Protaetiibacter sp. WY-16]
MRFSSYVAVGDSFTEGVGDDLPDGRVRGWADLVALGLALSSPEPVGYANLAIRGRKLAPIAGEQVDAAIALSPQLISINGGGNDIMRPRVSIDGITEQLIDAVDRVAAAGIHVVLTSGANPMRHIPMGPRFEARGNAFARAVQRHLPRDGVTWVDNWGDRELGELRYWSVDKLHLGPLGHRRVAANVLAALEVPVPDFGPEPLEPARPRTAEYWREYVLPWIGRRLTGRSSGDNREPKSATLQPVEVP